MKKIQQFSYRLWTINYIRKYIQISEKFPVQNH